MISPPTRDRIEAEIEKYPARRGALLPALHLVHAELGYVSPEAARELAEIFAIRPGQVMELVSFYNMFHATPQPRHHVNVCTNLPCSLRGARALLRGLESHLGIEVGGATPDGRIGLGREECLGACGYAPMMRVDDRYHENLDLEQARRIVDALE